MALVQQHPDIDLIIYDLNLPDATGLGGFVQLRASAPSTPVLVLSGSDEEENIRRTLLLGAAGYVLKAAPLEVLKLAIEVILGGGIYVPPQVAESIGARPRSTSAEQKAVFTPRESEILPLLTRGFSNKFIARELDISEYTVRAHVVHILRKLRITKRAQVASKLLGVA